MSTAIAVAKRQLRHPLLQEKTRRTTVVGRARMGVVANVNSPRRMTIHTTRAVSSSDPPPPSSSTSSDDTTAPPPSPTARSYHLDHHHNPPPPPPPHNDHHQFFHSLNEDTPFQLCFLRHGQSTWNRDNRFIGWTDTPLTDDGVLEARIAGQMMRKSGIRFDEVHTSLLRRSIRTTNLVLMELHQEYIPVYKHWRLNERSYGDLVGQHKKEAVLKFGKDQVKRWRRSYDEPPPPMQPNHPYHPANDPRYGHMLEDIPLTESLQDTVARSSVYWDEVLAPALQQGKTLLVVGHENNLRSLLMRLEDISQEDVLHLNLPRAVPLAYRLDEHLKPIDTRGNGQYDEATGLLRGTWLGGDQAVKEILHRDYQQVYDTTVTHNLELQRHSQRDKWNAWMEFLVGQPSPYQQAVGSGSVGEVGGDHNNNHHHHQTKHQHSTAAVSQQLPPQHEVDVCVAEKGEFPNTDPVPALEVDPLDDCRHGRGCGNTASSSSTTTNTFAPVPESTTSSADETRAAA